MRNHFLTGLFFLLPLTALFPLTALGESTVTYTSPAQQTTLLELYTSEGCSSCPPADRWLSQLTKHPQLWRTIFPIAFHVDYWNYLGWEDEFSKAAYTQRQRNYARFNNLRTIYTPGFMHNGAEWRGWFRHRQGEFPLGKNVGKLSVSIENSTVSAQFNTDMNALKKPLQLHVAWLGFGIETEVERGENEGKILKHDFVSYHSQVARSTLNGDTNQWQFKLDTPNDLSTNKLVKQRALVFWVTDAFNPTPIQTTGGWY